MTDERSEKNNGLGRYQLKVYLGHDTTREPVLTRDGSGDDWRLNERLRIRGFDDSYSLSLAGFWAELIRNRGSHLTQVLTGYETITKFGNTMQLKQEFSVVVEAEFSGTN